MKIAKLSDVYFADARRAEVASRSFAELVGTDVTEAKSSELQARQLPLQARQLPLMTMDPRVRSQQQLNC